MARFEEPRDRPAGLPDWPFGNGSLGLALLFPLFFAAKYQSSFHVVRSPAPAIGASQTEMKHEDYGNFSVAYTATQARPLPGETLKSSDSIAGCSAAEAAARILELRKGNILPAGETIKNLINYGRA